MLRQSMIAAGFALATIAAAGPSHAASSGPATETGTVSAAAVNQAQTTQAPVHHRVVTVHRTVVHHVYSYEPGPAPYYYDRYYGYYGPAYAPAPVASLPAAAACVALALLGGC
jgi:hypothetical protein